MCSSTSTTRSSIADSGAAVSGAAVSGTVVTSGKALVGGPFELVDQHGRTRTDRDFRDRFMLVYFGYTFCPDVCPMTLSNMSRALEQMAAGDPDIGSAIVPLFVTVDPERDTVEALADYAPSFHPDLVELTGSDEQIARAAGAYRVYYAKVVEDPAGAEESGDYLMDHSSYIFLMGPDGDYVTHIGHQAGPEEIAKELASRLKGS